MMTGYGSQETNPLFDLNYVFEQRWGALNFDEGDVLQLSGPQGEVKVRISFASESKVMLGRASSSSNDDVDVQEDEADATLSTVSQEFRQQLLQMAAATDEERQRADSLREANLPLIDLRPFGADAISISRKHAVLELDGRYITLTDLQSTNGSRLNGTLLFPMQRRIVRSGDKLQLGGLQLHVHFGRGGLGKCCVQNNATKGPARSSTEPTDVHTMWRAGSGNPAATG